MSARSEMADDRVAGSLMESRSPDRLGAPSISGRAPEYPSFGQVIRNRDRDAARAPASAERTLHLP